MKPIAHTVTTGANPEGGRSAMIDGDGWHCLIGVSDTYSVAQHMFYSGPAGILRRIDWDAITERLRKEMQCND